MNYPAQSKELLRLLAEDQREKRELGRLYFEADSNVDLKSQQAILQEKSRQRTRRMLEILNEIGDPSISNVGVDGAQAISVLAVHDSAETLRKVLQAFTDLYQRKPEDTYYQAIPSMTDLLLILGRKPQRFGTQWLFDKNKEPFLPTVEDFEHVNERRRKYGVEPLRWPKSLAIPEAEQPWLKRPLSELVMRDPSEDEFEELTLASAPAALPAPPAFPWGN